MSTHVQGSSAMSHGDNLEPDIQPLSRRRLPLSSGLLSITFLCVILTTVTLWSSWPMPSGGNSPVRSQQGILSQAVPTDDGLTSHRIAFQITSTSGQIIGVETIPGTMLEVERGANRWALVSYPRMSSLREGLPQLIGMRLFRIENGSSGDSIVELLALEDLQRGDTRTLNLTGQKSLDIQWLNYRKDATGDSNGIIQPRCCVSCGDFTICGARVSGCGASCGSGPMY